MKIIFIGAGNVATHMATQLNEQECKILQVYSQTLESAQWLAERTDSVAINQLDAVSKNADYYIFCLKDAVLEKVISRMPHQDGTWIHTAGSMPMDIFTTKKTDYGVVYPLQTFSKEKAIDWTNIPLFIEGSDNKTEDKILLLAEKLSSDIYKLSTEQRKYVHLSGVYANNFVNQMYELANQLIQKTNLPFDVLLPLIEETCNKVHTLSPSEAQTGPAVRYDENVMAKHLELLERNEDKKLYRLISQSIYKSHQKG